MKHIQKANAAIFTNGPTCAGQEYSFDDSDLNMALVTVNGRYPEEGYVMNEVCKEAAYIVGGKGRVCTADGMKSDVKEGDAVLLYPKEKYYWEGDQLAMVMPCSPSFYPEQHKKIV